MKKIICILLALITAALLLGALAFTASAATSVTVVEKNAKILSNTALYSDGIYVFGESAAEYSSSSDGKRYVNVIDFKNTGNGIDMIDPGVDMNGYIASKKSEFKTALEKNAPAGAVIDNDALNALFGPSYYAVYSGIESGGVNYVYSDDFIAIGDEDDFENLYIVSGTVTRESRYIVKYWSISVTQDSPEWKPGDINGDGSVDNKDVVTLFRYVSGGNPEVNTKALDCNGDGSVDNKDVVAIFRFVSGGKVTLSDKPYIT